MYNLYSHFLSIFRIQQMERQHLKSSRIADLKSIDFDIFKDNVPIIKYENKEVQQNILGIIKKEIREDQITWEDFLKFLKMILAQSFSEKIDLFFYAFDQDKNSKFSWKEVTMISISCLEQMFSSRDEFVETLSEYFTKYIFETMGYSPEEEIPFEDIKKAIRQNSADEGGLLAMICGADQFNQS
mmetsp:Transcript_7242/g.6360  ORF Transcript_7242/g.6360 Transcript_7242/m.6360 type:complete len:185 (+) Transcript_7242:1262-1816(+)